MDTTFFVVDHLKAELRYYNLTRRVSESPDQGLTRQMYHVPGVKRGSMFRVASLRPPGSLARLVHVVPAAIYTLYDRLRGHVKVASSTTSERRCSSSKRSVMGEQLNKRDHERVSERASELTNGLALTVTFIL